MPTILAIDTSTEACSTALLVDGARLTDHRLIPRRHADTVLSMVRGLLDEAGIGFDRLDALACGIGPGSFTGIRIATAITQGLAFAHDLPTVPVSGLRSLAWQAYQSVQAERVFTCLDARINELYWAIYEADELDVTLVGEERLSPPERLHHNLSGLTIPSCAVGNGLRYLPQFDDSLKQQLTILDETLLPHADAIVSLAEKDLAGGLSVTAEELIPVYLRDRVARKPGENTERQNHE